MNNSTKIMILALASIRTKITTTSGTRLRDETVRFLGIVRKD